MDEKVRRRKTEGCSSSAKCYSYGMCWKINLDIFPNSDKLKMFSKWSLFHWRKNIGILWVFWAFFRQSILLLPTYKQLSEPDEINQNESSMICVNYTKQKLDWEGQVS